jgi:hypothetical protein
MRALRQAGGTPLRKAFVSFEKAFMPFEKGPRDFRKRLSRLSKLSKSWCERLDSNPDRLLYRNLNPVNIK